MLITEIPNQIPLSDVIVNIVFLLFLQNSSLSGSSMCFQPESMLFHFKLIDHWLVFKKRAKQAAAFTNICTPMIF